MKEPYWMQYAREYLGVREVVGPEHNPIITQWLLNLRAWWTDDETPWCGVFVATIMRLASRDLPPHWYRAKAWATYGEEVAPTPGCIVVFERRGGGHVGFLVGYDQHKRLLVLGGNQGNRVSIAPFDPARAIAFRWPRGSVPASDIDPISVFNSNEDSSTQEA